jgi:hypothetical protein
VHTVTTGIYISKCLIQNALTMCRNRHCIIIVSKSNSLFALIGNNALYKDIDFGNKNCLQRTCLQTLSLSDNTYTAFGTLIRCGYM